MGRPVPLAQAGGPATGATPRMRAAGRKVLGRVELYLVAVLVILAVFLTALNRRFLTLENLFDLLANYTFLGIMALGELVVLVSGGIDVSFTAIATVAQYVMGWIISTYQIGSVLVAFLIPLPVGIALGLVNAGLVHLTQVHPVIITIATLNIFYGLLVFVTGGAWIYNLPASFQAFAVTKIIRVVDRAGTPSGLSVLSLFWAGAIALTWFILTHLVVGRKVYAMGGNPEVARRAGVRVPRLLAFVYGYMGFLAAVAGFVQAQLAQIVQPNAIVGRELDVLAAAILGGASISGGTGTVSGTVLGVLLVAVVTNGLILTRVPSYWHNVAIGVIIATAAGLMASQRRRTTRARGAS